MAETILKYYTHPYVFFTVFVMIILYNIIHQYRSDYVIKHYNLKLNVLCKIYYFRVPFIKSNNYIDRLAWKKVQYLAKEFILVNFLLFSYYILILIIF